MKLDELVDLLRYPIDKLDSSGADLLSRCRKSLRQSAICYLPNFLTKRALSLLQDEIMNVRHRAFRNDEPRPAYAWRNQHQYPPTHVVAQRRAQSLGSVTRDCFEANGVLVTLFEQHALTEFVRRCLGVDNLYRVECPYLSVNAKVMWRGDQHAWHFDQNDGVVSILVQDAGRGGHFEFVPYIRDEGDEHYNEVSAVLGGETHRLVRPTITAGTFCLFKGRRSIHRVIEIIDDHPPRLVALFSYDRKPAMTYPHQTLQAVLGKDFDKSGSRALIDSTRSATFECTACPLTSTVRRLINPGRIAECRLFPAAHFQYLDLL